MADVEVRVPKDLRLTREQVKKLQDTFQSQLADVLRGASATSASRGKPIESQVAARVKIKNEVV